MAEKKIRQRIELHGEKEYNQALKDAQRNLKTLQTALKAETAELGKNASEQDKARVKAESLRKQIAEQEKVVKTLQEALAKAREEYGDNEAEVARWEQKLNNARATLAGMKNDLGGVGDGMQQISTDAAAATVATKSVADALGEIGGAGDAVAGAIEGIFQGMIDTVSGAISDLWGLISSTAAKANNWTDISRYWGTDAQTIQEYAMATKAQGKSFEDLQAVVSKLVLGGKGDKITELLGISSIGYKDQWQYAMDAMDMLYAKMQSGQDINPILETLFGEKKSTKVLDLLGDWGSVQQAIATGQYNGNESGYGMSDEELETMNDLWVKINGIEEKWLALKENFAAGFGVGTMELLVNVEGTLDGLAAYMNAKDDGEKQAALEQIRSNIEEFFRKVADIIRESLEILRGVGEDLQKSDDPMTRMVGNILTQVADALQWFVDNQEAVKGAFNAIFGVWLIAKLAAVAGKLGDILLQIEAIKAFKGINLGAGAAGAAGSGAATAGATGGGGLLGGIASKFTGLISKLGGGATGLINLGMVTDWFTHNTHIGRALSGNETWLDVANAGFEYAGSVQENKRTFWDDWKGVFGEMADAILGKERMEPEPEQPFNLTEAQREAAEKYYETLRAGGGPEDLFELTGEMRDLFEDQDELSRLLNRIVNADRTAEELPEDWFSGAGTTQMTDEERLRQALAAENEANARAAQAEAEARERNRNTADELLRTVTETQREAVEEYYDALRSGEQDEDLWERTGALRALFGDDQNTLDRLMRLAPDRDRATETKSADALEEAAGSLEKVGRVLGGIVIAETEPGDRATEPEKPAPEEPGFYPEGIVIAETEPGDRATEPKSADALEEAAGSLEKVGRVLGGIVIAETEPEEETIDEDLDDLVAMQTQALEDLFDAWRGTESGEPGEDEFAEFDRMWDFAQGIFGDAFGDAIEQLIQKMDENPDWTRNDDIPPEWLPVLNSATWNQQQNGSANQNGITNSDLQSFQKLPAGMQRAVEAGARAGVSGINVNLDGATVGRLVAPYVSEYIASEMVTYEY